MPIVKVTPVAATNPNLAELCQLLEEAADSLYQQVLAQTLDQVGYDLTASHYVARVPGKDAAVCLCLSVTPAVPGGHA